MQFLPFFRLLAYCVLVPFGLYTGLRAYLERGVIPATQIRVYAADRNKLLLHLEGRAAREAARHFVFEDGAWCDRSLEMHVSGQMKVEFWQQQKKLQTISFNLGDGQSDVLDGGCNKYLTKDSRLYWKGLVKAATSSP